MTKKILTASLSGVKLPSGFEGETTGWKMDGDKIALQDGNPVWVNNDGTESILKHDTISNLRNEAQTWRTRAEENLNKLKGFEGLDAAKARDALDKISKIDAKALIDAGEVDKVRNAVKEEYTSQLTEKDTALKQLQGRIDGMVLDAAFNASEFIRDNIAIPVEMFRSHFGQSFKVEDGKISAFDKAGNRVMSKKNIGEYADFDEAIELLVDSYSQKDSILKAPEHRGTGNKGGGGGTGTGRIIRRADLATMAPAKLGELMAKVRAGEIKLVD